MKKFFKTVIRIGIELVICSSLTAFASMTLISNVYLNDEIIISINGEKKILRDETTRERQYPLTYNGRTYIPLRAVSTLLGYEVDYASDTKTATINSKDYMKMTKEKTTVKLDGLNSSDIPVIQRYTWSDSTKKEKLGNPIIGSNVANVVNSIFMYSKNKTFSDDAIHKESPQISSMKKYRDEIWNQSATVNNTKNGTYLKAYCDPNSVKYLKYAYDSSNWCKGFVASYTLTLTYYIQNEVKEVKNVDYTSVFITTNDSAPSEYAWVINVSK